MFMSPEEFEEKENKELIDLCNKLKKALSRDDMVRVELFREELRDYYISGIKRSSPEFAGDAFGSWVDGLGLTKFIREQIRLDDETYCCKCNGLIFLDEMPRCYIDGTGESAEVTCTDCCKWFLEPRELNRLNQ